MLIVVAAVVVAPMLLLGGEVLLARRGPSVDTPDVATLRAVHTPAAPTGELRVLWLGDSTAAAVGTSAPEYAVSSVVGDAVSRECSVTVRTEVIAVSGATIDDVVDDQLPAVGNLAADAIVISVGANDTVHLTSLTRFTQRYRNLIGELVGAGIAADRIVLIGVPDMGSPTRLLQPLRAISGARSRRLDARVRAVAKETGTGYVNLFKATSKPFRADPKRYFAADKYHPSDAGYALWGKAVTPVVAKICD